MTREAPTKTPSRFSKLIGYLSPWFLYAALVCGTTWPLVRTIGECFPRGKDSHGTVVLFNLWTMRWNALKLGHAGYWDAPIFYPEPGTFALSEPSALTGLVYGVVERVTGNPVVSYNLILLLALTLNGHMGFRLFRVLGIERTVALLGGALMVTLPFVFDQLGVIQQVMLFPVLGALECLFAFGASPRAGIAIRGGLWVAAAFLTCTYNGLFLSLFLLIGALVFFRRSFLEKRALLGVAIGLSLCGTILAPFLIPQRNVTKSYQRSERTIELNSAVPADYLRDVEERVAHRYIPGIRGSDGRGIYLFPGIVVCLLAAGGAAIALRSGEKRRFVYIVVALGTGFLVSLGPHFTIANFHPYEWIREFYPGMKQLRSPFRIGVFTQLLLLPLACHALVWLRRRGRWLPHAAVLIAVLETTAAPFSLFEYPRATVDAPWTRYMKSQEHAVMAMIPFAAGPAARDFEPTLVGMLAGLEADKPQVNGYSGLFPLSHRMLRNAMASFPDADSIATLARYGVTHLVVDRRWLAEEGRAAKLLALGAKVEAEDPEKITYGMPKAS